MWLKRALVTVFLLFSIHAVAFAQIPGGVQQHGSVTPGDCTDWYGTGVIQDAGAVCGSGGGGSLTVGTTTITGGTPGQALTINSGVLGSAAFGTGTVTSVATGPGAVGGTITTSGTISTQELTNSQTGSNYAILTGDWGKQDQLSNAANQIPTIAAAGSTGFPAGFFLDVLDPNTGVQLITPATSTINGMPTWAVLPWNGCRLTNDGTNYWCTNTASLTPVFPNASSTGTTVNKLAKLTGAPSTAVITATTDTSGAIGVVVSGAGTTGNAQVANNGLLPCTFDGATTAGHYVEISANTAGDCEDTGAATYPTSGQVLGRVLSTNVGGGVYLMDFLSPGIQAASAASGNALFGTTTGNTSGDFVCMANTTVGVADCGSAPAAYALLASPNFTGTVGAAALTATGVITDSLSPTTSQSALLLSGAPQSGGSTTTSFPLLYLNDGAGPTTFLAAGTEIGVNAPTAFAGNFIDFHLNGGASLFNVNSAGSVAMAGNFTTGNINMGSNGAIKSTSGATQINSANSTTGGTISIVAGTGSTVAGGAINITGGQGTAGTANGGAVTISGGTSSGGTAGAVLMPNLPASSAATTGTVCWTTGGTLTVDTTLACLASLEDLKDIKGRITGALDEVLQFEPIWYDWKSGTPQRAGDTQEQPGFGAHQIASVDKRLVSYSNDGKLLGVRYMQMTAVLAESIKEDHDPSVPGSLAAKLAEQQSEIEYLKRRVH
jgi:hypothetical protein